MTPSRLKRPDPYLRWHLAVCSRDWWTGMFCLMLLLLGSAAVSPPMRSLWLAIGSLGGLGNELTPLPPPGLFDSLQSLGVVAIGHAEGNMTVTGEPTGHYWGHEDPGNFRRNQGWCSDQGRGGGDVDLANQKCLERVQARLTLIESDLQAAQLIPIRYVRATDTASRMECRPAIEATVAGVKAHNWSAIS